MNPEPCDNCGCLVTWAGNASLSGFIRPHLFLVVLYVAEKAPYQPSALTTTSSPSSSFSAPPHPSSVAPSIPQSAPPPTHTPHPPILLCLHVRCHSQPISCSLTALPPPPPVAEQILGLFFVSVRGCLLESGSVASGWPHPPEGTALRRGLFVQSLTKNKRLLALHPPPPPFPVFCECFVCCVRNNWRGWLWQWGGHNPTPYVAPRRPCSAESLLSCVCVCVFGGGGTIEISAVLAGVASNGVWLLLRSILIKSAHPPPPPPPPPCSELSLSATLHIQHVRNCNADELTDDPCIILYVNNWQFQYGAYECA